MKLITFLPLLLGTLTAFFIDPNYYSQLKKPDWAPPKWLFGPVWTVLYILMGFSLVMIMKDRNALILFWVSLFFNLMWAPVFFGLKDKSLAFKLIIVIDLLVLFQIIYYWRISKNASLLNIPLLLWCLFATYLNYNVIV